MSLIVPHRQCGSSRGITGCVSLQGKTRTRQALPADLIRRPPLSLPLKRGGSLPRDSEESRPQGSEQDRVLASRLVVLQHVGERSSHDAASVASQPML